MKKFLSFLRFSQCLICGALLTDQKNLCVPCRDFLPRIDLACFRCGLPQLDPLSSMCGVCLVSPPPYARVIAPYVYDSLVREWILAFKFHSKLIFSSVLAERLAEAVRHAYIGLDLPHVIIPMPLHDTRVRERGFNQSLELAKELARHLALPYLASAAKRIRASKPQSLHQSVEARRANVENIFSVASFAHQYVVIVDDVITSGATVSALTKTLLGAGVKRVDVWCVARSIKTVHAVKTLESGTSQ